jgi:hypothetical protein
VFRRALGGLSTVLDKAAAHCEANKLEQAVVLELRLFPDMFPLVRQVRQVCAHALGAARLAGATLPTLEDNEKSFADLKARIAKVDDVLKGLNAGQIDGTEEKEIVLALAQRTLNFKGQAYLQGFALPNFWFHYTTAYNILRHIGVPVGKRDFLGAA